MAQLICQNLCLGYDGREILHDLTFSVHQGDYLCIVGENGAGKSTLLKTILGLQPPLSGRILTEEGLERQDMGYLPQQTAIQRDFPATVWEIVLSGCQGKCGLRPFYTRGEKARARKSLARMELTALAKTCYRNLSGGQQQRVLLARALCATEKLLLLDEPVSGLDPKVTQALYGQIARLNREGVTILMISHDLQTALPYASHILHLGQRVFFGTRQAYLESPIGQSFLEKGGDGPWC